MLTMADRQKPQRPLRKPRRLRDSHSLRTILPNLSTSDNVERTATTRTFRVPSPTPSEEAEITALESELDEFSNPSEGRTHTACGNHYRADLAAQITHCPNLGHLNLSLSSIQDTAGNQDYSSLSPAFDSTWQLTEKKRKTDNMVVEREPPKTTQSPQKQYEPVPGHVKQAEFGKASPLQNRLLPKDVFNIPKANHQRPEHHRAEPPVQTAQTQPQHGHMHPFSGLSRKPLPAPYAFQMGKHPDVVEIPRPQPNAPWRNDIPVPQPYYSSLSNGRGFIAVNPYKAPGSYVDLTQTKSGFDPDAAIFDDKFGAADPYTYVDAGKATENIKALLEGAFDEEDEKPRTRRRKKKYAAAMAGLTDKLKGLDVEKGREHDDAHKEEADEEDEDDGTVEGLNVKLLPHQVDGVEWMRDKESRVKKKNGVLPKGGILADDMGLVIHSRL